MGRHPGDRSHWLLIPNPMNITMKPASSLLYIALSFLAACNSSTPTPAPDSSAARKTNGGSASQIIVNPKPVSGIFDQSPMDMIYFPTEFPKLKSQRQASGDPKVRVIYSRPQRHNRAIFGGLQKYGQPWRMGANEATEIQLFTPASVNGKKIAKGTYILYCIPEEKEWTIVFNSASYTWGLQFDPANDVLRTTIPVEAIEEPVEALTMFFTDENGKAILHIEWDHVKAQLPFSF